MRKVYYTIYDNKTDSIIAHGDAPTCAKQLNMALDSFYSTMGKNYNGKRNKYTVVKDKM